MSAAYTTQGWGEFFVCAGAAAAALSGLIFVGLSVNVGGIRSIEPAAVRDSLIGRGLEALVALLNVLVISVACLTPDIARGALSALVLVVAAESAILPVRASVGGPTASGPAYARALRVGLGLAVTSALVLAGITYASQSGGGLYWLPAAFGLAIMVAALSAWTLLLDLLRS